MEKDSTVHLLKHSDAARGFSIANNHLRIHWLLRRLTLDRFDLAKRSAIFVTACKKAALGWLIDFAESAYRDYHPREGKNPEPEQNCLTTLSDAESLHRKELGRIRGASKSDELGDHRELPYLLYRWRDVAHDDGAEVKQWTNKQLAHDDKLTDQEHQYQTRIEHGGQVIPFTSPRSG